MDKTKPDDIRVAASFRVSRHEYDYDVSRFAAFAATDLRLKIADYIQNERAETIITDDMVEKRLDLYVASPDVFWKIVRKEAEKLMFQFMPR